MLTFDLMINPIIVLVAVIGGGIVGIIIGKMKLASSERKVNELEKEIMSSHAEILDLQKAYFQLEGKFTDHSIPVISMKLNGKENNPKEKATK